MRTCILKKIHLQGLGVNKYLGTFVTFLKKVIDFQTYNNLKI